ncbi:MAG: YlxR family protein [Ruminococcus sp.]|nr:YlxR family protein [Ruminococcus sp.]
MKQKKVPMRKCTGCGEMKPKRELVRVVKAPDEKNENGEITAKGGVSLDLVGKKPGRGAYVCKSTQCLEKAIKAKRFERAFSMQIPEDIFIGIKEELKNFE